MPVNATLTIRKEEFRRRVESLPSEIQTWKTRTTAELDRNAHFSQINAIEILMNAFVDRQRSLLNQLNANGDAAAFKQTGFELVKEIIKSQKVWDFFRDKLDLRFSPTFKDVLWIADTIAWDCYHPVLDSAREDLIVAAAVLREPPLTYLTAEFSPATWVRGSRPNDGRDYHLGTANLPVPVIELPWDHVGNLWEFLSLHHEVGHDIEADLKLRGSLLNSLQQKLTGSAPPERIRVWQAWLGEVFPDLVGLQLGGSAFAYSLLHLLLLPKQMVTTYDPDDPHPTHYVRIPMNAAYIRTLVAGRQELEADAADIEAQWTALYGNQPQFDAFVSDFPLVFEALMDTAFPILKGKTVRELMPFKAAHDIRIREAAAFLLSGQNAPGNIPPRHCVSAARLAVNEAAAADSTTLAAKLQEINDRTNALIRSNAPPGLRAADNDTTPHKNFIRGFAETISV